MKNKEACVESTFSENLAYWLNKRALSQYELADKIGVSAQTISNYVNGNNFPRMNRVDNICLALGITRSQLLDERDKDNHTPPAIRIGVSIKAVQERLGHDDFKTTMDIYNHVMSSDRKEAVEKFSEYLEA